MSPKFILFLVFQCLIILGLVSPSNSQNNYDDLKINSRFDLNQTIKIPKEKKSNKTMMVVARKATKNIFVDIPISTDDVGHTFVAILEYKDQKVIKFTTYGKYPEGLLTNGKYDYSDITKIVNNEDLDRLHFEELPMTDQQLQLILKINSQEGYYDLFKANCAHYTTKIMNVFLWYHNGLSINTENPAKYHAFFKNRRVNWD